MKFTTFRKLGVLMMMSLTAQLIKRSTHVDEEEEEEEDGEEEEEHTRRSNNPQGGQRCVLLSHRLKNGLNECRFRSYG